MKKNSLFTKFRGSDPLKGPLSSRLRLENLEDRRLLSVTDLAGLAAASDAAEPVQYAAAANVSDAAIDVSSVLKTSGTAALQALTDAGVVFNVLGASTDEQVDEMYITSVPGGELSLGAFPNLTKLHVKSCALTSLDVSNAPNLRTLYCDVNNLTTLDVSANTSLEWLTCSDNSLTTLTLGANTNLRILGCSNNNFTTLNLSANTGLTDLYCSENINLTTLDVSANTNLEWLDCCDNVNLSTLILGANTSLNWLDCSNTNLSTLDVSANPGLATLDCSSTNLSTLDLSQNTSLNWLDCSNTNLSTLDLGENVNLVWLECNNNPHLTTLDVSANTNLTTLSVVSNFSLTTFVLGAMTGLTTLDCYSNPNLTALDVSAITSLAELYCHNNNLTTLTLGANTNLTVLYCFNNNLTTLDVSAITSLEDLACENNNLTTLNLSANTLLQYLSCEGNNLTKLDLSANTSLEYLYIDYDLPTLIAGRSDQEIEINFWDLPDGATVEIRDSSNVEITSYTDYWLGVYFASFDLPVVDPDVPNPICATTTVDGVQTQMLINPETNATAALDALTAAGVVYDAHGATTDDAVTQLTITHVPGGELCLGAFPNLTTLDVSNCALTSLDVANAPNLLVLHCFNNNLTTLDVSANTSLTDLSCFSNSLTTLTLDANTSLTILSCSNNNLAALDLSENAQLVSLYCSNTDLSTLDLSANASLRYLECNNNTNLSTLDLGENVNLERLECGNNTSLSTLDLSNNTQLVSLLCSNTNLSTLDLSENANLAWLNCSYNANLTTLNVGASASLTALTVVSNPNLTTFTLGAITSLATLNCCDNTNLTTLDVSAVTSLTELNCFNNNLTTLTLGAVTSLTILDCSNNSLTTLDVGANASLEELYCHNNNLTTLDVGANTLLLYLSCNGNNLTTLDLSANTSLETSYISYDLPTLIAGRSDQEIEIYLWDLPDGADVEIRDSSNVEIPSNIIYEHGVYYALFNLPIVDPDVPNPIRATTTVSGAQTQLLINPMITLDDYSGSAYYVDADKELTNVNLYGVAAADLKLSVSGYTVEESAAFVDVANGKLIYKGGLDVSAAPYVVTITAESGGAAQSVEYALTVNPWQLAAATNLSHTATVNSITLAWDAVAYADLYEIAVFDENGQVLEQNALTNSYTATGLTSNTEYEFFVYARSNNPENFLESASASYHASTLADHTLTVTPIAVTVYNTDANVAVADVATTGFVAPAITVDKPEFDFVNNQVVFVGGASGTYTVTVTASEDGVVRTQTFDVVVNKTKLATPANFRTTAVTNSSVTFAWDLVPYADRYTLVFYGGTYDTTATSPFTWTGLASDTEYLFVIRAFGNDMVSSDAAALTVRTAPDASGAWATLSTDSPVFGDTIVVSIAPDSTATYAWYSVDADDVETPLGAATSEYQIADVDLIGKRLKAVVTYASGEFTGQVVSVTTANPVVQEALGVTISQVVPYVGAELTAYPTIPGATVDYQWYRVGDGGEEAIADATLSSYTVTAEDVGFYLKVVATGTGDYTGSASAMTAVLAVAENPLTLSTLDPVLGGRIRGYLNPADSFATYQWQVYDEALGKWDHIEGATYSYFTPSYGLVGKYLRLRATYTRTENAGLSVSVATNRVERPLVSITISGDENLQTGSELTTALVYKYATADYQWYRGAAADGDAWTAIEGATGKTYTASDADKGYYLKVVATGTGVFSGVVEDVTAESVFVERLSFVTGAYPQLGERIQVALNPAGPATYAWSVVDGEGNATAIPGYTASYWTPSYDHVGYTVRVTATYLSGDFAGQSYTLDTADVVTRDVSKMHITLYPDSGRLVGERVGAYVVPTYATVTYQWYRVDAEDVETLIDGATNKRYTTTSADEGFRMKVVATGVHPYVNSNSAITSYTIGAAFSDAELDEDVFDLLALSLLD